VDELVIGDESNGITFRNVARTNQGDIWSMDVEVADNGLRAKLKVWSNYAVGFDDLITLFADMARDWRGWTGERVYETIEHDLRISGTHRNSRIELDVELNHDRWQVRMSTSLDAGEQLSSTADGLAVLLGENSR
jgi:hypothetical protein